jgi:hypothetical protein
MMRALLNAEDPLIAQMRGKRVLPNLVTKISSPDAVGRTAAQKVISGRGPRARTQVRDLISSETLIFFPLNTPCY